MSELKIYGTPASRTFRVLWMAEELGIDYEHVPVEFRTGACKTPEFRAINPNGRIPAIRDDKTTLWESLAINLYLAKRHPGPLSPKTLEDEAQTIQWSMWALTEAEPHIVAILLNRLVLPEDKRDAALVARAEAALKAPFEVLDGVLAERDFLVGDSFTVADLNVCSVVSTCLRIDFDLGPYPNVMAWIDRGLARPAARAADEMRRAAA